jgi:hypothetical protein
MAFVSFTLKQAYAAFGLAPRTPYSWCAFTDDMGIIALALWKHQLSPDRKFYSNFGIPDKDWQYRQGNKERTDALIHAQKRGTPINIIMSKAVDVKCRPLKREWTYPEYGIVGVVTTLNQSTGEFQLKIVER